MIDSTNIGEGDDAEFDKLSPRSQRSSQNSSLTGRLFRRKRIKDAKRISRSTFSRIKGDVKEHENEEESQVRLLE